MKWKENAAKPLSLYILFEKSSNGFFSIDFWALYWIETAARDGKHEDVMQQMSYTQLTIALCMFLIKNYVYVGKKSINNKCFYWPGKNTPLSLVTSCVCRLCEKIKLLNQNSVYSPSFFFREKFIYSYDRMMLPREWGVKFDWTFPSEIASHLPVQPVKYSWKCGRFMEK